MTESISFTADMAWVMAVLGLTVFLFVSELVRVDVTAIIIMVLLGLFGLVSGDQVFSGFASNAVISIIAVMIIGAGLDKTGVMNRIAQPIMRFAGNTESRLIALISGSVGIISSFMQNIGAAALFLPAVKRISTRTGLPLTRLLMPMGFCAILGGTVTLVGSSPLILLNDLIQSANKHLPAGVDKMEEFHLFDVTPIGLALIAAGILYFIVFGRFVLPRSSVTEPKTTNTMRFLSDTYLIKGDVFAAVIPPESELDGRTLNYVRQHSGYQLNMIGLLREGEMRLAPPPDTEFRAGDKLAFMAEEEVMRRFAEQFKLDLKSTLSDFAEALSPAQAGISEVIVAPRSSLIGKTTRELQFRKRYKAAVLAIYRGNEAITEHISDVELQSGDALLLHSRWDHLKLLDQDDDFIVVTDYPRQDLDMRPEKIRWSVLFFAVSIGLVLFSDLRLSVAFMTGAIGMVVSGVLRIDEAYRSVDWRTVFLLAGLIPLGIAVDQSGTAAWIAHNVVSAMGDVANWVLLLVVAVLATGFSLVMSNVGATVLLVPLAVNIAIGAGADPRIFALVVALATSNSFILPTHQVNALIMGAGGYRNADFLRAGGIMSVLFLAILMLMLTLFY